MASRARRRPHIDLGSHTLPPRSFPSSSPEHAGLWIRCEDRRMHSRQTHDTLDTASFFLSFSLSHETPRDTAYDETIFITTIVYFRREIIECSTAPFADSRGPAPPSMSSSRHEYFGRLRSSLARTLRFRVLFLEKIMQRRATL